MDPGSAAVTTTRASIIAALAEFGALVTIAINYRNSSIANETFRISERGQLTDRYAKAIELLGDTDSIAISLGALRVAAFRQRHAQTRRSEPRSQGSEYPAVVVPLTMSAYTLLQRNPLYTAVTRAKRLVVLAGSRKALAIAVRTAGTGRRHTGLTHRLQNPAASRP